jgi:hypothetical protein
MGVERAVTRWYLQRQTILNEIAQLECQIAEMQAVHVALINLELQVQQEEEGVDPDNVPLHQLQQAQAKLDALGPCPKPMMG